jgi:hypothetical protein
MLVQPLAGMLLIVRVATGPAIEPNHPDGHLSPQQKSAAMQPLVRSATECITHAVGADPRLGKAIPGLGDLIVDAVPSCRNEVRTMIDAFDHYFGEGTGETFFMGPYLDALPTAVGKAVAQPAP